MRFDMKLTDRAVITALFRLAEPCNQVDIAKNLHCGVATVSRSVARLKKSGFLTVKGGGGYRSPYEYEVNLDKLPDDLRKELESLQV
jgi:predicted transcriptional regulator